MKKLLIRIDHETSKDENDDEFECMWNQIVEIEYKVRQASHMKNINCDDMLNMEKLDDSYDIELEEIIRMATINLMDREKSSMKTTEKLSNMIEEKQSQQINQATGDNLQIPTLSMSKDHLYELGDRFIVESVCEQMESKWM